MDLYAVLEVDPAASERVIRAAYRRLARAYHPDTNPAPDAAERFKAIAAAYAVLSDATRRHLYDRTGQTRVGASALIREETDENAFE